MPPSSRPARGQPDQVAPDPAREIPPPSQEELRVLKQIGRHWEAVLAGREERLRRLPVDPSLTRPGGPATPGRFGRFAEVEFFRLREAGQLEATELAETPPTAAGPLATRLRRLIVGPPLSSSAVLQERMRKLIALPVLASDLLSSVAYGPEAMLSVLILAGSGALGLALPISAALVVLMIGVGLSYMQTIRAYPSGAGSYIVAGDNLGQVAGLAAAVGLITDYVLTVAVSVASGVAAVTSALPALQPHTVPIGLVAIGVLLAGNLRGIRQAGYLFAAPTYAFVLGILLVLGFGFAEAAGNGFRAIPPPPSGATEALTLLLILRAFSSGATSMTGIEAVSNAIPAFQPVEWKNARTTLQWMVGLLVIMFVGLILLIHLEGIAPRPGETVLSQLAHRTAGRGFLYAYIQAATALILLFAANTSFNDFPRLLYFMARSYHAPRIFLRMGDRLAFSNGIIALAIAAAVLYLAFRGVTDALIPLYAVGVFLAFTLSQTGMVVHWWRHREAHWRKSMAVNGLGALMAAVVLVVAAATKFTEGAWVVVAGIPLLIWIALRIRRHYDTVRKALAPRPIVERAQPSGFDLPAGGGRPAPRSGRRVEEREESPEQIQHMVVAPVSRLDLANLRALAYAASLGQPVLAVHISVTEEEAERFRQAWSEWGDHLPLEVVVSPYRAVVAPLARYIEALHKQRRSLLFTVVVPELVVRHFWHSILHSQIGPRLRRALRPLPGIVIASLPIHLPG